MRVTPGQRALAFVASVAVISACSSGGSSTPGVTPTPSPSPTTSGGATSSPIAANYGVAYIPDGGYAPGKYGIFVVHFEDVNANLIASAPSSTPALVSFPGPVGPIAHATDGSGMIAAMGSSGAAPPFSLVQLVYGLSTVSLLPVGTAYNAAVPPTPTSSPNPTPTPYASAIVPDISGAAIMGTSTTAVGLITGPLSSGILGIGSLTAAPPVYAGFVPWINTSTSPPVTPPNNPRYNISVSGDNSVVLVRGPSDIVSYTVTFPIGTYQFATTTYDATLGSNPSPLRGRGAFGVNPGSPSLALVAQAPGPNDLTYVSGLPGAFTHGMTVTLASRPHSIAFNSNGTLAVVGTDAGFYVIGGASTGTLVVQTPYLPGPSANANSPQFIACDGNQHYLMNVTSIGVSTDNRYVALYGSATGVNCPGGSGALVAVPLVDQANTPSPSPTPSAGVTAPPTSFVQNNLPLPSPNVDYMRVR